MYKHISIKIARGGDVEIDLVEHGEDLGGYTCNNIHR